MPAETPNFLTTGQAAQLCSVTPDTILKWIKRGQLAGARTAGGHYRIRHGDLLPLMASARSAEPHARQLDESDPPSLSCWQYLSKGGAIRENCRRCVVYRVRAAHCFLMAGLEPDVGHARQFCENTCDECVYYRRATGLATNVLVITSDKAMLDRLADAEEESIAIRFARNGYEASAMVQEFRPAFAVVDVDGPSAGGTDLLGALAADSRVPGLRIIVAVAAGTSPRRLRELRNDHVVSVLEKPLTARRIADVVGGFPVDCVVPEDTPP